MKPVIQFLSEQEIKRIHQSSVQILDEIGMRFPHKQALEAMAEAGARIHDNNVVKIPEELIVSAIERVPKRKDVILYGQDSKHDISFTNHRPSLACMTMAVNVIDPFTRRKRPATTEDLAALTRIADQLENIGVNGGLVTPHEVPAKYNDWYTWATTLKNTTKHITGGMRGASCVKDVVKMVVVVLGGDKNRFQDRPSISGWVLTLPPLGIDTESLDALIEMGRHKIPAIISSGPILGASSPVTLAGTIAQAHAEILACITVSQIINPGSPMMYTSFARGIDMRTGNVSMACPEFGMLKVAMAQMGQYLDLPIRMPAMLRDAKVLDAQAGFETGMIATVTGLSADLMDAMQLDMDMLVDFSDLIFCNECMAGIKRMAENLIIDDKSMALDVMRKVGPGGNFLGDTHTFRNFRQQLWTPKLMERRNWAAWEKDGAMDIFKVAEKRVLAMLSADQKKLLPLETELEIDAIVRKAQG